MTTEDPEKKTLQSHFRDTRQMHALERWQPCQQMVLGKLGIHLQKNKVRSVALLTKNQATNKQKQSKTSKQKNNWKWIKDFNIKPQLLNLGEKP